MVQIVEGININTEDLNNIRKKCKHPQFIRLIQGDAFFSFFRNRWKASWASRFFCSYLYSLYRAQTILLGLGLEIEIRFTNSYTYGPYLQVATL